MKQQGHIFSFGSLAGNKEREFGIHKGTVASERPGIQASFTVAVTPLSCFT